MAQFQDMADGRWHQVVNDSSTYLETSVTAMVRVCTLSHALHTLNSGVAAARSGVRHQAPTTTTTNTTNTTITTTHPPPHTHTHPQRCSAAPSSRLFFACAGRPCMPWPPASPTVGWTGQRMRRTSRQRGAPLPRPWLRTAPCRASAVVRAAPLAHSTLGRGGGNFVGASGCLMCDSFRVAN
jgi:hypothetical protein